MIKTDFNLDDKNLYIFQSRDKNLVVTEIQQNHTITN